MRKLLVVLAFCVLVSPAAARSASLTLSPTSGPAGTPVTASGSAMPKRASGTVVFGTTTVASFTTRPNGSYSASFAVPSGYSGATTVRATVGSTSATASFNVTSPPPPPPPAACADGVDNDGDGLTDYPADPGCSSATDNDETNVGGSGIPMPPQSLWAPTSDWNTNVSALPVRADNAALVADLAARGNGYIFNRSYGVGVAFANAATPTYTVTNTRYTFDGVLSVSGVPIPAGARAADGNDGHMTVVVNDPASPKYGCVYDWFEAVANVNGAETSASYFDMSRTDHTGWLGLTRGSSANNLAGVLWPEHFNGTVPINFALAMWVDSARYLNGNALRPSKTTDGSGGTTKVPEGAKLRLKSSVDLSGYPAWLQRIGNAMKTYGVRVIDQHGDAPALVAVGYRDGQATTLPFTDQYGTGQLPVAFLQNMEVIDWPAADVQPQSYTVDPDTATCGTLNR